MIFFFNTDAPQAEELSGQAQRQADMYRRKAEELAAGEAALREQLQAYAQRYTEFQARAARRTRRLGRCRAPLPCARDTAHGIWRMGYGGAACCAAGWSIDGRGLPAWACDARQDAVTEPSPSRD